MPPPPGGFWAEPPPSVTLGWGPGALPGAGRVVGQWDTSPWCGSPSRARGLLPRSSLGVSPPQHPVLAPSRQERAGEAGDKTCSWGSPPLHSGTHALPCLSLFGDVPTCWGTSDQEGAKDGDPPGCPSSNQAVLAPRLCSYPDGCVRQLGGRGQSLPGGGVRVLPPPKLCKGAGVQSAPALG